MIVFVTTRKGEHTIDELMATQGWSLRRRLTALDYEALADLVRRGCPRALYVFADIERLDPAGHVAARAAWLAVRARGALTLNEPGRTLKRVALLERLYALGVNDFRAWPLGTPPPEDARFPVFLRVADDHDGRRSGLIGRDEYAGAVASVRARGIDPGAWIAVEHAPCRRADGLYAKYSAFIVGDRVLPKHVFFSRDWHIKEVDLLDPALLAEEERYLATNPHAELLRPIFACAGMEYGRIDYAVRADGRLRVWEINTNPRVYSLAMARSAARRRVKESAMAAMSSHLKTLDAALPAARPLTPWKRRLLWCRMRGELDPVTGRLQRELWRGALGAAALVRGLLSGEA